MGLESTFSANHGRRRHVVAAAHCLFLLGRGRHYPSTGAGLSGGRTVRRHGHVAHSLARRGLERIVLIPVIFLNHNGDNHAAAKSIGRADRLEAHRARLGPHPVGESRDDPVGHLTECMADGPVKESCLWAVAEVDHNDNLLIDESSMDNHSLIFGSSVDDDDDDDSCVAGVVRVARRGDNDTLAATSSSSSSAPTTTTTTTTTTCMSRLLADRDWETLLAAVEEDPGLARQWIYGLDPEGPCVWKRLPLHLACAYGAPLGLILVLLRADPEGLSATDPRDGCTPLHLCCAHQAPLPLVRLLLERRQDSVQVGDRFGRLPLHAAVLAQAPYGIIEALVEEYPGTVLAKDTHGKSAVDYAMKLYEKNKHNCCVYELLVGLSTMLNEYVPSSDP
jgi:Ankyrin repeats (3 copies)